MPEKATLRKHHQMKTSNPWVIIRKIVQGFSLCFFLVMLIFSKPYLSQEQIINNLVHISPLAMLSTLLSSRVFLSGSIPALLILFSSFFIGRAWCGWLCPLGTVLDVFHAPRKWKRKEPVQNLRKIKYGLLIIILLSAVFSNLTLLFLDPVTIFIRSITLFLLPLLDKFIYFLEKTLVKLPFLSEPIISFDEWLRPAIFPSQPVTFQYAVVFGFFFLAIILLNLIIERFWCRYLCPMGALLGIPARLSIFQRRVKSTCVECGLCQKNCPTATIDESQSFKSDPSECTVCMNCLESCKKKAITFKGKWQNAPSQPYDPGRRTILASLGTSAILVALTKANLLKKQRREFLLRPPGVTNDDEFLSKCVRCGICMQVCPTQVIQADLELSDLEGLWTPVLTPRIGYCSYSCNSCGNNCPVNAIPALTLEEKRVSKIGKADIDHERCIAWSQHNTCIVCEEMCPLPEKAINLETRTFTQQDGNMLEIKLPRVNHKKCIGCGICEYKCPVEGEAAIRVRVREN